ncbi:glycoside hydrolase family 43 protein [Limibacterium fermenti]|uniref:glycoside hydrolase family 43 protein n=1 Tax=Limibacterium fermenti TaxID=3229863 RepID=UPI003A6C7CEF
MKKSIFLLIMIVLFSCNNNPVEDNRSAQVETLEVEQISDITAMCKGKITDKGTGTISQYGIELDDGNGYEKHPRTISSGDHFGVEFVGLIPDKTYRYRAYVDDGAVQYGEEKSFTTLSAFVYTASVDPESITSNSAVISFTGVNKLKEWGFHYSETEVSKNDPVKKEFLDADILFSDLKRNTQYNILPYVIEKGGKTTYLEKIRFTTAKKYADIELADPTIFLYNDTYYLYGTGGDKGFLVYSSTDLQEWKGPAGVREGYALKSGETFGTDWFWAPQVFKYKNSLYMAYAANEQIAIANSDSPLGPFTQSSPFRKISGTTTQIDPYLFIDDSGKPYLYYVRFEVNKPYKIYVAELESDLSDIKTDPLLCVEAESGWEKANPNQSVTEGPTVIKHQNLYYLFYSANYFGNIHYSVGYATSASPTGPWTKYGGNPIIDRLKIGYNGSGHGDLFRDKNGNYKYVFHVHASNSEIHPRKTAIVDIDFVDSESGIQIVTVKKESFKHLQVLLP